MKKLALGAALFLLSAFVIVTVLRKTTTDPTNIDNTRDTLTTHAKSEIDDFWSAYNRGEKLFTTGQFDQSLDYFITALKIDSTHVNSWYRVGNIYAETGRYNEALSCFERMIELNPMSSRAHRRAGQILSRRRPGAPVSQERAKFHFAQAQNLNRAQSGPHYSMGRLLVTEGDTESGRELLEAAAATNPKFIEAFRLLGYADLIQGRSEQAISSFVRALRAGGVDDAPSVQSGEGDTKASLSQKGPYADKNIAALYGLAIAARTNDAFVDDVPENCRVELPDPDPLLTPVVATWTPAPPNPVATIWADMDGDGRLELITIGPHSPLQVWHAESNSKLTDRSANYGLTGSIDGTDLLAFDFDSDKDTDIFVLVGDRFNQRRLILLRNDGQRFTDVTSQSGLANLTGISAWAWVDSERTKSPHLVFLSTDQAGNTKILLYSAVSGQFQSVWNGDLADIGWPTDIAVGDFDNDGYADLFITRWKQPSLLMRNIEGQSFVDVTEQSGLGAPASSLAAEFLDFNHDNLIDLFVSEVAPYEDALRSVMDLPTTSDKHRATVYLNQGDGSFESIPFDHALGQHYGTLDLCAADFNGDGYTDIYLANGGFAFDRFEPDALLLNHAGQFFTRHYTECGPTKSLSVSFANFAADNRPRLLISRGGFQPGQPAATPTMLYMK